MLCSAGCASTKHTHPWVRQSLAQQTLRPLRASHKNPSLTVSSLSVNVRCSPALLSPDRAVDMRHTCTPSDLLALFPHQPSFLWRWRPHDSHLSAMCPALPRALVITIRPNLELGPSEACSVKEIMKYVKTHSKGHFQSLHNTWRCLAHYFRKLPPLLPAPTLRSECGRCLHRFW